MFAPLGVDAASGALKMRLDVTENDEAYQVKADIPGVKKEDIAVRVDGNIVRIDAQMKSEKETRGDGDRVVRSERSRMPATRRVRWAHRPPRLVPITPRSSNARRHWPAKFSGSRKVRASSSCASARIMPSCS
jgi:hypothetical protein